MDTQLRRVEDADLPFLQELYHNSRREEMANWGWTQQQQQAFVSMQFQARQQHYDTVYPDRKDSIVVAQETRIGALSVAHGASVMTVVDIALLPEFQGQGIGGALIQALQQEAEATGRALRLHILGDNHRAAGFYRQAGFTCVDDHTAYHLFEWRATSTRPPEPRKTNTIFPGAIHV